MNTIIKAPAKPFNSLKLALAIQLAVASSSAWPLQIGCPAEKIKVNISAQEMDKALNELAQESGFKVIFYSDVVKGIKAKAIAGEYENCERAIDALLSGTGLRYSVINENAVAIHEEDQTSANYALEGMLLAANGNVSIGLKGQTSAEANNKVAVKRTQGTIEEIIVTATKRAESIQDVPISISAIGENQIRNTHSQSLQDLAGAIPNFNFPSGSSSTEADISIRGVFQRVMNEEIGFDVGYGVYVDGVFVGKQMAVNTDLANIERVEVLRGPQGTLFGKNTISGAINITSKKPSDDLEGNIEAETGNLNLTRIKGSINVPMIEGVLATRLAISKTDRNGYATNTYTSNDDLGNIDQTGGRLQVTYTPYEETRFYVTLDGLDSKSTAYAGEILSTENRLFTLSEDIPSKDSRSDYSGALTIEQDIGNYTATSITAKRKSRGFTQGDSDNSELDVIGGNSDVKSQLITQELRINSPADTWLNYVAGVYYLDQNNDKKQETFAGSVLAGSFAGTGFSSQSVDVTSLAAYFHTNLHLSDKSTIFLGARYTDEKKELEHSQISDPEILSSLFGFPSGKLDIPENVESKEPSWTIGLRHNLTDKFMVYGSVSTGFKSGGFNTPNLYFSSDLTNNLVVESEFVTNYEIGAKSSWLDNRLRMNAAIFYLEYEDLQIRSFDPTGGVNGGGAVRLRNAAEVTSKGFELEISAVPANALSLHLGLGYVDATFDKFPGLSDPEGEGGIFDLNDGIADGLGDASGNRIPRSPKWTANASVQHELLLANNATWLARFDYSYQDESFSSTGSANIPNSILPSYSVINARMGYQSGDRHWGIFLWGKNLTNEDKLIEKEYFNTFGITTGVLGRYMEPRTYGLTINYSF